jgi:predicted N-acetyltransferase YhbS
MAVFAKRGFVRDDWALYCNLCDLTQPIPNLPTDGFVVREVQPGEYEERVAAHRDVWHPSVVTFESYAQLRAQAGYEPNLDLVAVVPNMLIASYCHGWMDYPNKIGEFEPVGTRKAHQRKGYGKAVLLEGLRRMKALGADTAMVYCLEHNLPFYGSVGFKPISKWLGFSK